MADVFISYSHKDEVYAERLYQYLSNHQISVWYAPYKVEGGSDFTNHISDALAGPDRPEEPDDTEASSENLRNCQIVALVLSENAMLSLTPI